jgi:hypothetical protein
VAEGSLGAALGAGAPEPAGASLASFDDADLQPPTSASVASVANVNHRTVFMTRLVLSSLRGEPWSLAIVADVEQPARRSTIAARVAGSGANRIGA